MMVVLDCMMYGPIYLWHLACKPSVDWFNCDCTHVEDAAPYLKMLQCHRTSPLTASVFRCLFIFCILTQQFLDVQHLLPHSSSGK